MWGSVRALAGSRSEISMRAVDSGAVPDLHAETAIGARTFRRWVAHSSSRPLTRPWSTPTACRPSPAKDRAPRRKSGRGALWTTRPRPVPSGVRAHYTGPSRARLQSRHCCAEPLFAGHGERLRVDARAGHARHALRNSLVLCTVHAPARPPVRILACGVLQCAQVEGSGTPA